MAECRLFLATFGYEPVDVVYSSANASLKRALESDPELAEAHWSLSMLLFNTDDVPGAEAEAKRALELNPSLPEPYWTLSEVAGIKGDPENYVKHIETAHRLDPIRPLWNRELGDVYFQTGRVQEALVHWREAEHLDPAGTYRCMTDFYLSMGDIPKAREVHAKFAKLMPTDPWVTCMEGFIDVTAGDRDKALEAIRKIEES